MCLEAVLLESSAVPSDHEIPRVHFPSKDFGIFPSARQRFLRKKAKSL